LLKEVKTMSGLGWYHWLWLAVLLLILFRWFTRMARNVPRATVGPEPTSNIGSTPRFGDFVPHHGNQQFANRQAHHGLPPYTSHNIAAYPSYIDYTTGYPPEPPPTWAPPAQYSQAADQHGGQGQHQVLSQLDAGALPTYEEAIRAQPIKNDFPN